MDRFPGLDGFLGTRASCPLDLVFLSLFAVVPLMAWSIWLVRARRRYGLHKRLQLWLGASLLLVVTVFELEVRIHGWNARARPSPYWRDGGWNDWIDYSLAIHLVCAVPTFVLWVLVIVQAWRRFPVPVAPCSYSRAHKFWAWPAAVGMACTAVTGWLFYWLAFVAS